MISQTSYCASLRNEAAPIWDAIHAHPFLEELAADTLDPAKFRFYLEQDTKYLEDFARVVALGAAKAETSDQLKSFTDELAREMYVEIPHNKMLLDQIVAAGAAEHDKGTTTAPTNLAYTSYMMSVAQQGGPLEIRTVLMPCAWTYYEIGERLDLDQCKNPVYAEWVRNLKVPEFKEAIDALIAEMDAMALSTHPSRMRALEEIFLNCSRYELAFWEMAYRTETW